MGVALIDYAKMPRAETDSVQMAVAPLQSLEAVVNWIRELRPAREIEDIVAFDEYSHDVVIRLAENRYLVFDTT